MNFSYAISDGYIVGVLSSTQHFPNELTDEEKDNVYNLLSAHPTAPDGYDYKLRADNLEWEMVKLPEPEPVDENADISDYENALSDLGVRFGD